MASWSVVLAGVVLSAVLAKYLLLDALVISPLRKVPGPKTFAVTKWRLAYEDWRGTRTQAIDRLHRQYGPVVRIGPSEVSFNSLSALRTIYGPGSRYGRTDFYRMFDVYGHQNLFTFHSATEHGQRKKLLSNAYSKTAMLKPPATDMVEAKVKEYIDLVRSEPDGISDIFSSLHYYSLDNITAFIYGRHGATSAMGGAESDRSLLGDILDPARRRLSWFAVHWPALTQWLYTRRGVAGAAVRPLLPMQRPAAYSGIRAFSLDAYRRFESDMQGGKGGGDGGGGGPTAAEESSIIGRLWKYHESQEAGHMDSLDLASECADHSLAGIDTTSDSLMFLVWSLSLPENRRFQDRLADEVRAMGPESLNEHGLPRVEASDRCAYLGAVIKETLRLYAPLPSYQPRSMAAASTVDGYEIPAHTTVGISPYSMHRNPDVFEDPLRFDPDRWLGPGAAEMNRWFWAFSSGGRMCIGMQ